MLNDSSHVAGTPTRVQAADLIRTAEIHPSGDGSYGKSCGLVLSDAVAEDIEMPAVLDTQAILGNLSRRSDKNIDYVAHKIDRR